MAQRRPRAVPLHAARVAPGTATLGRSRSVTGSPGDTCRPWELLSVSRQTFYGSSAATIAGENTRNRYYRGSWAFVHFLQNGPAPIRAAFKAFIEKLDRGEPLRDAWHETLGKVPRETFEADFAAYLTADEWTGIERPIVAAPPTPIESVRPLRDEEVHLLWARLSREFLPPTDPRSASAQIAEAARSAPGSPEVSFARGRIALEFKRVDEASAAFAAALALSPEEPRYLVGALAALAARPTPWSDETVAAIRSLYVRLAATARTADELAMVARLEADDGKDAEALRHADAAVAADPANYGTFASRAFVHFRASRYAEAVRDQERAVALLPEEASTGPLDRTLEIYRESLHR